MPRVVALYRHPVKGFTPEACDAIDILPDGRVAGDRTLGFAFANRSAPDDAWTRKYEFVVLANTPGIARLHLRFDHAAKRLRIEGDGAPIVDEAIDAAGRARISAALQAYVLGLDENPLSKHPARVPIRLIGDGETPRHQDNEAGQTTLHSRESLAAVTAATGLESLDELRFRSNIAIDGVAAWDELKWIGRRIRIGSVDFDVVKPKVRCLAIDANPVTGERDLKLMKTIKTAFVQDQSTFGVGMLAHDGGGRIHVGDALEIIG